MDVERTSKVARRLSGVITATGPVWEELDGIAFEYSSDGRAGGGRWSMVHPKTGAAYVTPSASDIDVGVGLAEIIPGPFGAVMVLDRPEMFLYTAEGESVVRFELDDGQAGYRRHGLNSDMEVLMDPVETFIVYAAFSSTSPETAGAQSELWVTLAD
jgi:hypothetical protein